MDALVSAVTAFGSWGEMADAMAAGYVPTIRGRSRRERLLIRAIKAAGFRVWGNRGRNW